ncbi:MAG TPA: hypothetical protein VIT45_16670 [Allosphingosinicella sp.]
MADLNIAEIFYEDGTLHYRYARYMSQDGTRWIRHGLFYCYHPNGELASEGTFVDGHEQGLWIDYHPNGQQAARGHYQRGKEIGHWEYWNDDGTTGSPEV